MRLRTSADAVEHDCYCRCVLCPLPPGRPPVGWPADEPFGLARLTAAVGQLSAAASVWAIYFV